MAAAELKLQVGLDLAFFRQQLAQLGTAATGYSLPINIDRLSIQKEITKLGKNISNRSYTLQVKTTAKIAEAEVDKLKEALDKLQGKEVGIKITGTLGKIAPKDATKIRNDLAEAVTGGAGKKILVDVSVRENAIGEELRAVRKVLNEKITPKNGKILVAASIRNSITNEEAKEFRESVKRKIGNIIVDVTGSADQLKSKEAKGIRTSLYQSIISNGGKIKIPATLTIANSEVAAFQKAVNSQFAGITVKIKAEVEGASSFAQGPTGVAGLEKHLQTQGLSGGNYADVGRRVRLREQLKTQSKAQLLELAKQEGLARYSKLNKDPLIERLVQEITSETAERILGNVQNMLRNAGGGGSSSAIGKMLDTFARGVFHMLGMDPAAMVAAQKQKLLPPAINWQSSVATPPQYQSKPGTMLTGAPSPTLIGGTPGSFGLLPAAYRGIGPGRNAGALPPAYRGIGPSAKPAGLLPSLSSAGQSNAIIEALIASTGPRRLPSGGGDGSLGKLAAPRQTKDAVDAILRNYFKVVEVQVKEVFSAPPVKKESLNIFDHLDMGQYFNYLAQARINTENAIKRSIEEAKQVAKQNRIKDAAQSFLRALEDVVRNAEQSAFAQSRIAATRSYIQRANIREIGQPLLEGRQVAPPKMLSAATGFYRGAATPPPLPETQAQLFARRESEARVRSALRSVDAMGGGTGRTAASYSYAYRAARPTSAIIPYGPGGALATTNQPPTPPAPPGGGRGGFGSFGGLGRAMANVSLPRVGIVSELGGEFAMAAKQVLLFGTAYKALAFLTDFPSKVGEAVAQLQTFRNTLQAITPNADEFQKSNQFILDTVDKYNTPLQSARDGFTNLYASMAPAGFKGDEIRNIFSGVSQAAATFGMSADKVDRVNYAFAQMASKGQVMSEELKGQLGDVLPGAVAIFAKAAGFTGPNAMVDFTKAMEKGRYKGEAMKQLLINVGIVMKDEFAKGAEGAAQNFQGQMNAMANATKKLYETFEPAGNLFSSKIIAPFTQGLAVITDGFNAFFSGTATKTAGGFALSQELEKLRPTFKGIADNIKQLLPVLQSFATTLLGLGKILLQVTSNPFVGYLARVYLAILPLTIAIQALNLQALVPMIGSLLRAIPAFIAFSTAAWNGASRTVALRIAMQATGQTATIAGGQVALLSNTLKTAFVGTIVGAVAIGIGMIIERIMTLGNKMEEAKGSALRLQDSIKGMSKTELQVEENKLGRQGALLQELQRTSSGQKYALLNKQQEEMVMKLAPGSITRVAKAGKGGNKLVEVASGLKAIGGGLAAIDVTMLPSIEQKIQSLQQNIDSARLTLNASDKASTALAPIPGAGDDPKAAAKARALYENQKAYADKLSAAQTEADIKRQTTLFDNEKSMINMAYDLREARANSFEKQTIRFQKELFNIEMTRQKAVMDANNEITKARGKVAGGTGGIGGINGGAAGLISYITGDPSQKGKGYQADHGTVEQYHDHLAFATRELAIQAYNKLTAADIKVTEFKGYGKGVTGPHSEPGSLHHQGLAMDVPGYQWGGTGAIGAKEYTGSARVRQAMGIGGQVSAGGIYPGGKVYASQSRTGLAAQAERNALQDRTIKLTLAEAEAIKQAKIATVNYVASIMPVAELQLQNQLTDERNKLQLAGISDAALEFQMSMYEAKAKEAIIEKELLDLKTKKANTPASFSPTDQINLDGLQNTLDELKAKHPAFYAGLAGKQAGQIQSAYSSNMGSLKNQLQLAGIIDPYGEQKQKYMQGGQSVEQADAQVQAQKQLDTVTKLRDSYRELASTIGSSFGDAFKGIITGSMTAQEALAGFFQNLSNYFADAVSKMIAEWLKVEAIKGLTSLLGDLGGMFGGGGGSPLSNLNAPQTINNPLGFTAANGGIAAGGFRAFATGGIVTGPTLGLVGEGRYNEAVIPLPDGKSVPVDLGGMSGGGGSPVNVVVNVDAKGSTVEGDESKANDLGRAISVAVQSELIKQQRPGGLLASTRR